MVTRNSTAAPAVLNSEAQLLKLNAQCAASTGLESFEGYNARRKAVLVEIEQKRALTHSEFVNAYGYDAWAAKMKPAAAQPAPAVTSDAAWPLIASCEKCGESRARRQTSTCAICGCLEVSFRPAVTPTRSDATAYRPMFHPMQTVWFVREGEIVEAKVTSIDDPETGMVRLYCAGERANRPSVHKSKLFTSRENAQEAQDVFYARPATQADRIVNRIGEPDFKSFSAGRFEVPVFFCGDAKDIAAGRC